MQIRRSTGLLVLSLMTAFFLAACGGGGGGDSAPPPPDLSPVATTVPANSITSNGAVLNAIVNPKGLSTTAWFEYSKDPALVSNVTTTTPQLLGSGSTDNTINQIITGLESGQTYSFRVTATNSGGTKKGAVFTLSTLPLPTVTTTPATSITTSGAVLNGIVNPNGRQTTARFEYGETQTLGTPIDIVAPGNGIDNVIGSTTLTGLKVATTYYFRIVATNSAGTSNGTILNFITAGGVPTVTTNAVDPSTITASGAVLTATVNPSALPTYAWFEYGTTTSLGSVIDNQLRGSGTGNVLISTTLSGQPLNTKIYFRAAASNSIGTSNGDLFNFTTLNPPPIANAGSDQTVYTKGASGVTVATLDGSGSASGHLAKIISSYLWEQIAGTTVALDNSASPTPTFTAPAKSYGESEDLQFRLTVTDNTGLPSLPDNVTVTVKWGFLDDFFNDTTETYTVAGSGSFAYDSGFEAAKVTVGGGASNFFSHTFGLSPSSDYGVFSLFYYPVTKPGGSGIEITLGEDGGTYYHISTLTDNVVKYVGSVVKESVPFPVPTSYSTGSWYLIKITFTPLNATIEAFGQTLDLTFDGSIPVFYFGVLTNNHTAIYDDFKLESLP